MSPPFFVILNYTILSSIISCLTEEAWTRIAEGTPLEPAASARGDAACSARAWLGQVPWPMVARGVLGQEAALTAVGRGSRSLGQEAAPAAAGSARARSPVLAGRAGILHDADAGPRRGDRPGR